MNKQLLEKEIKELIVKALDISDISPTDIPSDVSLFGDAIGLDSIDSLEIGIALKKKYGITINQTHKKYFYSVSTLANLVLENIKVENK